MKFDNSNSNGNSKDSKYKVKVIQDSVVYIIELEENKLLDLYYLVLWKSYSKEKNIWEPTLAI